MYRVHSVDMFAAAPQSLPAQLAAADLNLRGLSVDACDVVLVDDELPVAVLSLSLPEDGVHELRVRVELPERCNYTLQSRLYAMSVEHVDGEGRSLPLDADLQLAVCEWAENERVVRLEIEGAWARAEKWQREADLAAAAE
jgi:hypothetical protein